MLNSRIIRHCQITGLGLPEETRAFASCVDATGSIRVRRNIGKHLTDGYIYIYIYIYINGNSGQLV